jgi:hypothetical protein
MKEDEMGGVCSMHGRVEKCARSFDRRPESKRPLGKPNCRSEDNIRMDLKGVGQEGVDLMHLASG